MKNLLPLLPALEIAFVSGCATTPTEALQLSPQAEVQREVQTRHFDGSDETAVLTAGLGVLQDLGFTLDGGDSKLGVLSASRRLTSRRPLTPGEMVTDLAWTSLFSPVLMAAWLAYDASTGVKEPQFVRVSLVTQSNGSHAAQLRVTAQRLVYKDENLTKLLKAEPLDDPAFYEEFFTRLGKSVFLEEQKI